MKLFARIAGAIIIVALILSACGKKEVEIIDLPEQPKQEQTKELGGYSWNIGGNFLVNILGDSVVFSDKDSQLIIYGIEDQTSQFFGETGASYSSLNVLDNSLYALKSFNWEDSVQLVKIHHNKETVIFEDLDNAHSATLVGDKLFYYNKQTTSNELMCANIKAKTIEECGLGVSKSASPPNSDGEFVYISAGNELYRFPIDNISEIQVMEKPYSLNLDFIYQGELYFSASGEKNYYKASWGEDPIMVFQKGDLNEIEPYDKGFAVLTSKGVLNKVDINGNIELEIAKQVVDFASFDNSLFYIVEDTINEQIEYSYFYRDKKDNLFKIDLPLSQLPEEEPEPEEEEETTELNSAFLNVSGYEDMPMDALVGITYFSSEVDWSETEELKNLETLSLGEGGYYLIIPKYVGSTVTIQGLAVQEEPSEETQDELESEDVQAEVLYYGEDILDGYAILISFDPAQYEKLILNVTHKKDATNFDFEELLKEEKVFPAVVGKTYVIEKKP